MNSVCQSKEHSSHFLCKVTGKRVHDQEKGLLIAFHAFTYTLWLPLPSDLMPLSGSSQNPFSSRVAFERPSPVRQEVDFLDVHAALVRTHLPLCSISTAAKIAHPLHFDKHLDLNL
jgi:hypothetical protein